MRVTCVFLVSLTGGRIGVVDFLGDRSGGGIGVSAGGSFMGGTGGAAVELPAMLLGAGDDAEATEAVDLAALE